MKPTIHTIDDVIRELEIIITNSELRKSPRGYFAALYRKVTVQIKKGIEETDPDKQVFHDNVRMERLDIVFAKRYIDAFYEFKNGEQPTASWELPFTYSREYWPIVLQHLLIGMNAHINLDLGIAAAEVMKGQNLDDLEHDFNTINEILSSLVSEVEDDLSSIWPGLRKLLKLIRKVDNFLVDFSMKIARDGAWDFACKLHESPDASWGALIGERDQKVLEIAKLITSPGPIASLIFKCIRLFERGNVEQKIKNLMN